jgi:hypothetical protein
VCGEEEYARIRRIREDKKTTKESAVVVKEVERISKRCYGTVHLNQMGMAIDAGTSVQEIVQHRQALLGSDVEVTLETVAKSPNGFPTNVARIVTENTRTLKLRTLVLKRTRIGLANEILS